MWIFLLIISKLFAAIDTGDGSDGACNFNANVDITARTYNCTTLTTSGAPFTVNVTDGYVALVFKVQGDVTINAGHTINLVGEAGPIQDGTNHLYAVGLAGGGDGGDGAWNSGSPETQTSGTSTLSLGGMCGNDGEDAADAVANCPAGTPCGGGGGAGGSWGTAGGAGDTGAISSSNGLALGCVAGAPTTSATGGSSALASAVSLETSLVGGAGGGGGGRGHVDDGFGSDNSPLNGAGGAGGGAIKISSGGTVTIAGTINVSGGAGGAADNLSADSASGGGGGGAGGTIFIQATSGITVTGNLTLAGGVGGAGGRAGGAGPGPGGDGGVGGLGRLRFDTTTGQAGVDLTGATITGGVTPAYFTISDDPLQLNFTDKITSGCGSVMLEDNERGSKNFFWLLSSFIIALSLLKIFFQRKKEASSHRY